MINIQPITITSNGYHDITQNFLESIVRNNIEIKLDLYALDNESFEYFNERYDFLTVKNDIQFGNSDKLLDYFDDSFGELMIRKFQIIFDSLSQNEYILYLDSDIVIKNNFLSFLAQNAPSYDILFQNDKRPSKPNEINLCAGFMCIKSSKKTLKFFNPENIPVKKIVNYKSHDQTYINKSKNKFKYGVLPLDLFPNGPHFYNNSDKLDPFIVHFNYLVGNEKISKMKTYDEWYLS